MTISRMLEASATLALPCSFAICATRMSGGSNANRAEPADDDDDEDEHEDLAPIPAVSASGYRLQRHVAESGQRRPATKTPTNSADAVAERFDHLAVLDAGADQQSEPCYG